MSVRPNPSVLASLAVFAALLGVPAPAAMAGEAFVAGLAPDRRPVGAPSITAPLRPQSWYVRAVTGITPPYPRSLFFLDNQGEWYTPFNRPGMVERYDLRGWHKRS
ncbi:MAG: hypothetical protein ABTQ29_14850 [Siculibacillus sp.]